MDISTICLFIFFFFVLLMLVFFCVLCFVPVLIHKKLICIDRRIFVFLFCSSVVCVCVSVLLTGYVSFCSMYAFQHICPCLSTFPEMKYNEQLYQNHSSDSVTTSTNVFKDTKCLSQIHIVCIVPYPTLPLLFYCVYIYVCVCVVVVIQMATFSVKHRKTNFSNYTLFRRYAPQRNNRIRFVHIVRDSHVQ